jgi:hypothetical protein
MSQITQIKRKNLRHLPNLWIDLLELFMQTQSLSQPTLASHLRALYALIRKDWKQYWRYPLNAVSSVFQPLIWIAPCISGLAFSADGKAHGFAIQRHDGFHVLYLLTVGFINGVFGYIRLKTTWTQV